ncbi:MAG: polyphosphate kinase 1 [Pirellulales bacterium]|nr:polyphosphate kinase 1 [Pirellulales bacterium]
MAKKDLDAPELYINRELSWLEFNDRVLQEGLSEDLPLWERLKFLAIVSSNLDEFFMVRVAGLMQQQAAKVRRRDLAGMTPAKQLAAISRRAHQMVEEQTGGIRDVLGKLTEHGLGVFGPEAWTPEQHRFLQSYFTKELLPILTPLAVEELEPAPLLPGQRLHVAAVLGRGTGEVEERIVAVPVPSRIPRLITMPGEGDLQLARLEDVVAENIGALFSGCEVLATAVFRITRDADVAMQDDDAGDLLQAIEEAVLDRRRRAAVRLEISAKPDRRLKSWLAEWLHLTTAEVYEIDGMLDATVLWEIVGRPGFDKLKAPDWPPQPPRDLIGTEDLWAALQDHDVLLFHPYESFDSVVQLLELAAHDPGVLAIKQTLYRTSGDSPIIQALRRAAENGKEVTVLVELKARFDEARNVQWARQLEDAGCHVVYGIAGFKTHGKALLIVRRESQRIQRYVHLSTGNYNDKTARLYSDIGLMTADRDVATDVAAFFNLLTGYSETVGWSKLTIAPTGLRQRFVELIEREIQVATPDQPGLIMAKVNSLEDPEIIRALYRASQAGVKVMLNVRGICCLRPNVKGISRKIEVTSIVDRYLEHIRLFYFRNGGHEEVYLSSADWMRRNLSKRLEILFPVLDPNHRQRLVDMLETLFADNVKARQLTSDGTYEPVVRKGKKVRAQERFFREAVKIARSADQTSMRFRPLRRPKD